MKKRVMGVGFQSESGLVKAVLHKHHYVEEWIVEQMGFIA